MFHPASRLEGIQEYYFAGKLREIADMQAQGCPVINLGIGNPDLPPAPAVIEALYDSAQEPRAHGYQSYTGTPELRRAFASWYQRFYNVTLDPAHEILPLLGAKEGIMHIAMAFLQSGDAALTPDPGYPAYRAATALAGAEPIAYTLQASNDWLPDFEALEQLDLRRVKIMWVNYPHMPSGRPADPALFEQLAAFGRKHRMLIVNDNPYSFILNERPQSIFSAPEAHGVALELNSLSKSHNMAGWRVGMLAGSAELIRTVLRFKSNMDSGMLLPVQKAAVAALEQPQSWYDNLNTTYRLRQNAAYTLLSALGCRAAPGQQGLFVWGQVPDAFADAYALSDALLQQRHVFVTPGGIFGEQGKRYVRVSLCNPVNTLAEALSRIEDFKKQAS